MMTVYAVVYDREDGGHVLSSLYDNMAAAELHAALLHNGRHDLRVQPWHVQQECRVGLPDESATSPD